MQKLNQWLHTFSQRQDIILAAILLMAIFMMIIPLPTLLVDMLIAINMTLGVTLLLISAYIREPMEFSSFPAVLLITTLYRLALTVSTSRLILLQHDAGDIIYTFGSFALGGNLAVGLIVYAIITIVQFIVITKGSERVAEVSARFSLDGMPGKQMSIDNDMRAGVISGDEARSLRLHTQKESQLYGAMDGAMKFVKGDAIASIIIILVNILGGIAVGVFIHGMSAGEAANTYAILSVGDGLVAQIPALLISIAAGIMVTRVPDEARQSLAHELFGQVLQQRRALWIVIGVLVIFALVPGFPSAIFLALACLLTLLLVGLQWRQRGALTEGTLPNEASARGGATTGATAGAIPLLLRVATDLWQESRLRQEITALRQLKLDSLGLPLPEIVLQHAPSLPPGQFEFQLYQAPMLSLPLRPHLLLDLASAPHWPETVAQDPFPLGHDTLRWVSVDQQAQLDHQGLRYYQKQEALMHILSVAVDRCAAEFIGVQETHYLMMLMEKRYDELVHELQRQLPVGLIAEVMQRLVGEGISIQNLRTIFEALVEWAPREKDPVLLTEYARLGLRRQIVGYYTQGNSWLNAWVIGPHIEESIRESIRQTSAGSYSAMTPEENQAIVTEIEQAFARHAPHGTVLVTALDIRRYLRKIIERELYHVPVLSFQEIGDAVELKVFGHIELYEPVHEIS